MQRWKSAKCTPSAQPTPSSSASERPVKSSQVWLKKVHRPSRPDIHSRTGAASAMLRKRCSLSRISSSTRLTLVTSQTTAMPPTTRPSASYQGA
jgi:hypothetical protein